MEVGLGYFGQTLARRLEVELSKFDGSTGGLFGGGSGETTLGLDQVVDGID